MSYRFRKYERKKLKIRVLLQHLNGDELAVAASIDFSDSGAKLELESPTSIPKEFLLTLSTNSAVQRKCELAWSSGELIGVSFIKAR